MIYLLVSSLVGLGFMGLGIPTHRALCKDLDKLNERESGKPDERSHGDKK